MQIKILKDRPALFGEGAMTNGWGIVLECSMFAIGMYKPFKIWEGGQTGTYREQDGLGAPLAVQIFSKTWLLLDLKNF